MLKTNAELRFFETPANNDPTKRRHISEDSNLHLDRCKNLTFRMKTHKLSTTVFKKKPSNSDDQPPQYVRTSNDTILSPFHPTSTLTNKNSPDLTFICPCIANIFAEYNQQDAAFLKFIYFCKTLYMFQTVFPSIIRSTKLHIQRQAFVRPLLLMMMEGKKRLKHAERLK